jgi:hypothetical protein
LYLVKEHLLRIENIARLSRFASFSCLRQQQRGELYALPLNPSTPLHQDFYKQHARSR